LDPIGRPGAVKQRRARTSLSGEARSLIFLFWRRRLDVVVRDTGTVIIHWMRAFHVVWIFVEVANRP
jgi:hypothetical protein